MKKYFYIKFVSLISVLSFIFHFAWEWLQCGPFFTHRASQATPLSMVMATLGDVLMTYVILGGAFFIKNLTQHFSPRFPNVKMLHYIELISFIFAVCVEKYALATNRWAYTDINPIIPILEVSALPVLQMMLLTPVILYLSTVVFRKPRLREWS